MEKKYKNRYVILKLLYNKTICKGQSRRIRTHNKERD